jgi:hypothetical protein
MNYYLEHSGSAARLHPEKVAARGLDRTPEPRVSISDSNAYKFHGRITANWQKVLDHRAARDAHRSEEQALASDYWEHRKQTLGITVHVPHEVALERIAEARTRSLTTPPRQRSPVALAHEAQGIQQHLTALEHYHGQVVGAQVLEQAYRRLGRTIPERTALKHDALLTQGQAHGISRAPQPATSLLADRAAARERQASRERQPARVVTRVQEVLQGLSIEDEASGPGLQVRLSEKEHDRSEGMGW